MTLTPRLSAARDRAAAAERRNVLLRIEVDRLTEERDAWAARCADAEDTVRGLRDRLTRSDSVAVTALRREVAMLRETVAALDARGDELRRAVTHWESTHSTCERALKAGTHDDEQAWDEHLCFVTTEER